MVQPNTGWSTARRALAITIGALAFGWHLASAQVTSDLRPTQPQTTSAAAPASAPTAPNAPQTGASQSVAPAAGAPTQIRTTPAIDGANTAWLMTSTALVLLMTIPGIMLFYSGMLRSKNALSIVVHTLVASGVVTLVWVVIGYSLAFTNGTPFIGGLNRLFADGLVDARVGVHPAAPTVPEPAFFMFQLAFAIITFALVIGATVERMRLSATVLFSVFWVVLVYAPVAHWIWHPTGWLAQMGHMDFAGGTVVHIVSGVSGLVAAMVVGPRRGFLKEAMPPHDLLATVLGAGLLWIGWFGFNAGSAFEAGSRAAGALLVTHLAACCGALAWATLEYGQRGQVSVLGVATGAIAGLIGVTPASGFVDVLGGAAIGAMAGALCFVAVTTFKTATRIDDSLDVFALHGVAGFLGTVLVPVFAVASVAPVTATIWTNLTGAVAAIAYTAVMTWLILQVVKLFTGLRVDADSELAGLDLSQHGETIVQD